MVFSHIGFCPFFGFAAVANTPTGVHTYLVHVQNKPWVEWLDHLPISFLDQHVYVRQGMHVRSNFDMS